MKSFYLTITLIVGFASIALSQNQVQSIKMFPLDSFIAPDYSYNSLSIGTGLNSNLSIENQTEPVSVKQNSYQFSFNIFGSYSFRKNTQKIQSSISVNNGNSYTGGRTNNNDERTRDNRFNLNLNSVGQNRFYTTKKRFWGTHFYIYTNANYYNHKENNELITKAKPFSTDIELVMSKGFGRIEPVTMARRVMDILISLAENNRLKRTPTENEINQLAIVATQIINQRFFDSRHKRIYELEMLNSKLDELGLISSNDIVYYANLSDIWEYALNFGRGSGKIWELGVIPTFTYNYYHTTSYEPVEETNKSIYRYYGAFGILSYQKQRPLNYSWQFNMAYSLLGGYTAEPFSSENEYMESTNGAIAGSWEIGYNPNTRTYASLTAFTNFTYLNNSNYDNLLGYSLGLNIDSYYYVSPRIRVILAALLQYTKNYNMLIPNNSIIYRTYNIESSNNYSDTQSLFDHYLVVSLNYALF